MSSGPVGEEACLKCHSMVRWNKEYAPIKALFATNKGLKTCLDEKTGNVPIHIAAQNGRKCGRSLWPRPPPLTASPQTSTSSSCWSKSAPT